MTNEEPPKQTLHLTVAARLIPCGIKVLQAAQADEPGRSALNHRKCNMAALQPKTTPPTRESSMLGRVTRGTMGAVIAAIAGLLTVVIVGMVAWGAVVGPSGAIIAAVVGILLGGVLRSFGDWPVRSLAGGMGGAVGGFFAVAAAEQSVPGSMEWAVRGGLLGAAFSVAVAAVAGIAVGVVVALVWPRQ